MGESSLERGARGRPGSRPRRVVRVEIGADKLQELLRARRICAADLRCLDCDSKDCLWRLCLDAIAEELGRDSARVRPALQESGREASRGSASHPEHVTLR
jgi:hypothetical protein